jgi:hypothetical protein
MNLAVTSEPVIAIIMPRSHVLYIRSPNTAYGSIYQRNKRLRRLDLGVEIFISLDPEILAILINALVVLTHNMLLKLKVKRVVRVVRTN